MSMTVETMQKSVDSYMEAIKDISRFAEHLELNGSGCTHAFHQHFRSSQVRGNWKKGVTHIYSRCSSLFDYGRPKIIDKGYWDWKNSMLVVELARQVGWDMWHHEFARVSMSEDGGEVEDIPAEDKSSRQNIHLLMATYSWGIKDFLGGTSEMEKIASQFPYAVKGPFIEAIRGAHAEVVKWREALQSIADVAREVTP